MKLCSWGANTNGQLGHGYASEQVSRPLQVSNDTIINTLKKDDDETSTKEIKINGGGTQTLISVTSASSCSTLLKIGSKIPLKSKESKTDPSSFAPKPIPVDFSIKDIACGWDFNVIISRGGRVYTWGENKYGQLGQEGLNEDLQEIPEFNAEKVAAGLRHAAAIGSDGKLYQWGDNSRGQLGSSCGGKILREPTLITAKDSPRFVHVKCGKGWTLCMSGEGEFWGCGTNKFGQLGAGEDTLTTLTRLNIQTSGKVVEYDCGWNHVLALLEDGKLISWGRNNLSQLGRNAGDFDASPKLVEDLPEPITAIACGSEHNLAISQSGKVYAWGWNEHENCGVKSSRISFCESSGVKLCEDCVVRPTIVDFPGSVLIVACGAGNGFAVSV